VTTTEKKALARLVARLADARRTRGLSQAVLARRLGKKHQSFVAKVESGERRIDLEDFVRWARLVDLDPGELLVLFEEDLERLPRTRNFLG